MDFLRAARGVDLRAVATVVKRGRGLCFVDVEVAEPGGELVAKGLVTYKVGREPHGGALLGHHGALLLDRAA